MCNELIKKSRLSVALVQCCAESAVEKNIEAGLRHVRLAKDKGADIVLFPEMWSNGYLPPFEGAFDSPLDSRFESERKAWLAKALGDDSYFVNEFKRIARELAIGIVITYLSIGEDKPQNTAAVIDKNGEIILKYSKVHTCDFSLEVLLEAGEEFKVCDFCGVKLGVMICFDREFPESARELMLKGAEIILIPNACVMNKTRLEQLSTRAFENMVGVALANYPLKMGGNSCAYSPICFDAYGNNLDNTIVTAEDKEEILIAEFDLVKMAEYGEREVWGDKYRKVKAYKDLVK